MVIVTRHEHVQWLAGPRCANDDQKALVSDHEWTVISCNLQTNQIILRNPWGSYRTAGTSDNGVTYDGNAEVTMPLTAFGQYYAEVTFGNAPLGLVGKVVLAETKLPKVLLWHLSTGISTLPGRK